MVLARVLVGAAAFACFMAATIHSPAGEVPFAEAGSMYGNGPMEVFPIDLDRDGDVDLAVAVWSDDTISWFENTTGDGSAWTEHDVFTNADGAASVCAADLDRDGDIDLISASANDNSIRWYENTGGLPPTFDPSPHLLTTAMSYPQSVVAGDLDRDGDVDLVACSSADDEVSWFENDGAADPSFSRRIILHDPPVMVPDAADSPMAVHVADVNGDGAMDILWASRDDNKVGWLENDGTPPLAFTVHVVSTGISDGADDVWAVDVDGDGDIDVLASSVRDDEVQFFRNNLGDGTSWSTHTVTSSADGVESVTAGDVDADGDIDVLATAYSDNSVLWYENTAGSGLSWSARTVTILTLGPRDAALADIDGDGDLDVAAAVTFGDEFVWFTNQTIHRSAHLDLEHVMTTGANGADCVQSGDLDGDGDLDLAVSSFWDKGIRWYQNDGTADPSFTAHTIHLAGGSRYAEAVTLADLDRDGDLDVVGAYDDWVSHTDNAIYWFDNNGLATPGFTLRTVSIVPDGPVALDTADIDGDGYTDVVSGSMYDDTLRWYRSNGGSPPVFTTLTVRENVYDPMTVRAADMANHGEVDIVSATRDQDIVFWLWNDGATTPGFVASDISYAQDAPRCVCTADVDRDGLLDVISGSEIDDELGWFSNDGWGSLWPGHLISSSLERVMWVAADDLDRDGDVDVVAVGYDSDEIAWFEHGVGVPAPWSPHTISTDRDGPRSVVMADLDRDGDLDVASASYGDDTVAWYENRGGQYAFDTDGTAPASLMEGELDDVLKIMLTHDGRAGDSPVEFATMVLRFHRDGSVPMTSSEANAVFGMLGVYLDSNDSGVFEFTQDTVLFTQSSFTLTGGRSVSVFADGGASWRVDHGSPKTYFVAVQLASDAASHGVTHFTVTHGLDPEIGTPVSAVEDRNHDILLEGQYAPDVGGVFVAIETTDPIFMDGFESGDTSAWSRSVP